MTFLDLRHGTRKGVAQSGDDLEQRKIGIGYSPSHEIVLPGRIAREHVLEIAEEFWCAGFEKIGGAAFGFLTLVLVVEPAADRVVSVVNLNQKIGDRELQLVGP